MRDYPRCPGCGAAAGLIGEANGRLYCVQGHRQAGRELTLDGGPRLLHGKTVVVTGGRFVIVPVKLRNGGVRKYRYRIGLNSQIAPWVGRKP